MKQALIKKIVSILECLSIAELEIVLKTVSDILAYGKTNGKD